MVEMENRLYIIKMVHEVHIIVLVFISWEKILPMVDKPTSIGLFVLLMGMVSY